MQFQNFKTIIQKYFYNFDLKEYNNFKLKLDKKNIFFDEKTILNYLEFLKKSKLLFKNSFLSDKCIDIFFNNLGKKTSEEYKQGLKNFVDIKKIG